MIRHNSQVVSTPLYLGAHRSKSRLGEQLSWPRVYMIIPFSSQILRQYLKFGTITSISYTTPYFSIISSFNDIKSALPCLRRLIASLSPPRPGFASGPAHVHFGWTEALGQVFSKLFSPVLFHCGFIFISSRVRINGPAGGCRSETLSQPIDVNNMNQK
jgi:hypothetical protein